jgi:hypothetical protein
MNFKEIGSEFWEEELNNNLEKDFFNNDQEDKRYLLSGRTAIDLIIDDIKSEQQIRSIYFPSYFCNSMIQPFINQGIKVEFYKVYVNTQGAIDVEIRDNHCDAMLIINYFGIIEDYHRKLIEFAKSNNKLIIEDATHSIFSDYNYPRVYDYKFASLRKWLPIPDGAIAFKYSRNFNSLVKDFSNMNYVEERIRAFSLKSEYIEKGIGEKGNFLKHYSNANLILEHDYLKYPISKKSFEILAHYDINLMCRKRRENGSFLVRQLSAIQEIIVNKREFKNETPLFVPIFLETKLRDQLRNFLINYDIYCPIHWPVSSYSCNILEISHQELSLICDQRYGISEMEKIIYYIQKFFS